MSSYSVAVVEDEKVVRLGLASYFTSAPSEFHVVATFQNGMEAWRYLSKSAPDVVLCDVKMPLVDGIELIRRVTSTHPATKAIVLTSYADFEYARRAFANGASDYVLKHETDREGLLRVLRRAVGEPESGAAGAGLATPRDERSFVDFAASYLEARDAGPSAESRFLAPYRLTAPLSRIVVAQLHIPLEYDCGSRSLVGRADRELFFRIVDNTFSAWQDNDAPTGELFFAPGEDLIAVFEVGMLESPIARLTAAASSIQRGVAKYFNVSPLIALGEPADPAELTRTAAEQASATLPYAFAVTTRPIWYHEITCEPESQPETLRFHLDESLDIWRTRYEHYLESAPDRTEIGRALVTLTRQVGEEVADVAAERIELNQNQISELTSRLDSVRAAAQLGEAVLTNLDTVRANGRQDRERLREIALYMEQHYAELDGLRDIARQFDLSASHLSREFRRRHGITVTEKLHQCRIREAKRLIRFTSMSVKEISFAVGYHNPNYFSRSFKKRIGKTVTEYRSAIAAE